MDKKEVIILACGSGGETRKAGRIFGEENVSR